MGFTDLLECDHLIIGVTVYPIFCCPSCVSTCFLDQKVSHICAKLENKNCIRIYSFLILTQSLRRTRILLLTIFIRKLRYAEKLPFTVTL